MKFVLTSTSDKKSAKKLVKKLIKPKIAACVSLFKANSIYFWNSKICDEKERILLIKTAVKFKKIAKFIKANHNYEFPEIVAFDADNAFKKYKIWIEKSTRGKR
ncbi:divalent cation tolerance protein CutA [Campylobacter sp. RM16192]|uniref:divalent cation tolerance protein CutA n=1 Tax=Campylobacter sp. RM16192 TaxID=1660080 RepID=UPI001451554B|nr:divalent cation tolerance protein CutA [Campylobacter sp. RM16192]QCD52854.1 putative CutA1 divalent ion tolerance protein [Campylobacter sp. RM16192]